MQVSTVSTVSSLQQSISNMSNISLDQTLHTPPPHTSPPPHMSSYQPPLGYSKGSNMMAVPPISSSSTTSASSSPRQMAGLPSTGLSSLPIPSYSPVYNSTPATPNSRHFR